MKNCCFLEHLLAAASERTDILTQRKLRTNRVEILEAITKKLTHFLNFLQSVNDSYCKANFKRSRLDVSYKKMFLQISPNPQKSNSFNLKQIWKKYEVNLKWIKSQEANWSEFMKKCVKWNKVKQILFQFKQILSSVKGVFMGLNMETSVIIKTP